MAEENAGLGATPHEQAKYAIIVLSQQIGPLVHLIKSFHPRLANNNCSSEQSKEKLFQGQLWNNMAHAGAHTLQLSQITLISLSY